MSVLMTLWVQGNPDELERDAAANPTRIRAIRRRRGSSA